MRTLLCMFLAVSASALAHAPEATICTTTTEVLLDVVVRDKRAHILRDLHPEEVQVVEDGVPQKIRPFEPFERGIASEAAAKKAVPAPALDAMRDFVKNELGKDTYVGLFSYGFIICETSSPIQMSPTRSWAPWSGRS